MDQYRLFQQQNCVRSDRVSEYTTRNIQYIRRRRKNNARIK